MPTIAIKTSASNFIKLNKINKTFCFNWPVCWEKDFSVIAPQVDVVGGSDYCGVIIKLN